LVWLVAGPDLSPGGSASKEEEEEEEEENPKREALLFD
jgi:hypothetical protein